MENYMWEKLVKIILNEVDELLARLEDYTHGEDGDDITDMRSKISKTLKELN